MAVSDDDPIVKALVRLTADLDALGKPWALIGGFAVGVRGTQRPTQDIDVVVAVASNEEAQDVAFFLYQARGYRYWAAGQLERREADQMATIRMVRPGPSPDQHVGIDLQVASSGIEAEIAAAADRVELIPDVSMPVAQLGHLLALKALAGRPKDVPDFFTLRKKATPEDLGVARAAVDLIVERGFGRGKDLKFELERLLVEPSYDWG